MKKLMLTAVLAVLMMGNLFAKSVKIGYVNIQEVFLSYKETQTVNSILQGEKAKKQRELDELQESVRKLKENFEKNAKQYTKEEREKKEAELTEKLQELQGKLTESSVNLQEMQKKEFKKLEERIQDAIVEVAKNEGLDYIIEKGILYYGGTDYTQKVIEHLNKATK